VKPKNFENKNTAVFGRNYLLLCGPKRWR